MKKLIKFYYCLLYLAPAVLFFSYYPIISLGQTESMNLELSLPLIWLVIFDILSFIILLSLSKDIHKKFAGISDRKFFLSSLFPLYATLSIFWSANTLRAILTAGILWLLFFAIFSVIFIQKNLPEPQKFPQTLLKSIFLSTAVICVWCWLQCILDLFNLNQSTTLLCDGCIYEMFGFPHPNGFAIEPQFMGNLLLAPTILAGYLLLSTKSHRKSLVCLFAFFATTLFLTFSRGAIYSFILALATLIIIFIIKQKTAKPLLLCLVAVISFLFTLNAQGLMSQFSYTNDTYLTGVTKSLDQLTLGIFGLTANNSSENSTEPSESPAITETTTIESTFDGYVEESTNVRLNLTNIALTAWSQGGANIILFGTGLGGAGIYLQENGFLDFSKEIIQNQYASLLLETGLVGVIILLILGCIVIKAILKNQHKPLYFALILAYACSLLFFAGLPNALHIYLMPAIISKSKSVI